MTDYVLVPGNARWNTKTITWSIATQNFGNEFHYTEPKPFSAFWPKQEYQRARVLIAPAFSAWAAECGLTFVEALDGPDVQIRFGFAVMPYGAWCTRRPVGTDMTQCLIQASTTWLPYLANDSVMHDLSKQTCHEIGHALGFDHTGATPSIMGTTSCGLTLGSVDIGGAHDLYGWAQPTSVGSGLAAITGCQNDSINLTDPSDHLVSAGAGQDQIATGTGHDNITAGDGSDYVSAGGGNDTVDGGAGFDQLNAGAGNDMMYSGTDSDMIAGNEGADIIDAGGGMDWMAGGAGEDIFILRRGEVAGDTIADFQTGVDKLVLIGYGSEPLVNNGNGTWTLAGELFVCGAINEATDVVRVG